MNSLETINSKSFLDVLARQDENKASIIPVKKIRFEDLPKPTNIEPLAPVKAPDGEIALKIKTVSAQHTGAKVIDFNLEEELNEVRGDYIKILVAYEKKLNQDKATFSKIMADLGGNKEMSNREEPKELTLARTKYEEVKEKKRIFLKQDVATFNVRESTVFDEELKKEAGA